jgi:hypothetical protein
MRREAAEQPYAADGDSRRGCRQEWLLLHVRIRAPAPQLIRVLGG